MSELLPCPFCGGDAYLADYVAWFEIYWNIRHYPPEVEKAVERMKPVVIKPILLDEYHPDGSVYLIECENCKQGYKIIGFEFSDEIQHCRKCGQAHLLDWDEYGRIDAVLQKP